MLVFTNKLIKQGCYINDSSLVLLLKNAIKCGILNRDMEVTMFTQETMDFLFENKMKDSREWFNEHRSTYIEKVKKPMQQLVSELAPCALEIDSEIVADPKRIISRINRDTRFSKDKSIYRDTVWCTFSRDKKQCDNIPGLYFEFSPFGYRYGCGYYSVDTAHMNILRRLVMDNDPTYMSANEILRDNSEFELMGDNYKRPRYSDYPEEARQWLEKREVYLACNKKELKPLFSDEIVNELIDGFNIMAPIYEFLFKVSTLD